MEKSITVKIKTNYGTRCVYPVCEASKLFASISGNKTLTDSTISKIKELGYSILVEQEIL